MLPSSLRATESPMNTDLISSLQSMRDRLGPMLAEKFGDAFDGDMDTLLDAINHLKRDTTQPPHQDRGEVEQRARELLAAEYDRDGLKSIADGFRSGENSDRRAIRAIAAALTEAKQQGPGEVLARGWFHALPEDDYEFHDDASGAGKDCVGCIRAMIIRETPKVEAKRQTGGNDDQ